MEDFKVELIRGKKRQLYPFPCEQCEEIFWKPKCEKRRFCSRDCITEFGRRNLPAHDPEKEKHCGRCKTVKLRTDFRPNSSKYDGLQGMCRDCEDKNKSRLYRVDPETFRARSKANKKQRSEENRKFLLKHLLSHPCVDCGETDIVVLDFDHVRGEKKANIAALMASQASQETLQEEMDKCVIRCANCHRRKTSKERNDWRYKLGLVAPM